LYAGMLKKGNAITNVNDGKKVKLNRIVRMHSDDMEEITEAGSGEVVAMFGVDCKSMDTFSDGDMSLAMSSMFIPEPVMSISIKVAKNDMQSAFSKALNKFSREDPTLQIKIDEDTSETILSGMGELHLEVYIERMRREYNVEVATGPPRVNYKETIGKKEAFDWLHKKQTGGAGQYAKVIGYIEPMTNEEMEELGKPNQFVNKLVGMNIPPEYHSSCEKGANDSFAEGSLVGCNVEGVRVVLQDGASHAVDSSDQAFRTAMANAVRNTMRKANPSVLEPVMTVQVEAPAEFQGSVVGGLNKRLGMIQSSDMNSDGSGITIVSDVPLANMFGYSTELRSLTQGKGEFTMEYKKHQQVMRNVQEELMAKHQEERLKREAE
jgi:elongation factor G